MSGRSNMHAENISRVLPTPAVVRQCRSRRHSSTALRHSKSRYSFGRSISRCARSQMQRCAHVAPDGGGNDWLDMNGKFRRKAILWWPNGKPRRVLIVKKPTNPEASSVMEGIAAWLKQHDVHVMVEPVVQREEFPHLASWTKEDEIPDFCITLGGDGTVLYTASLFEQDAPLPPILSLALGTLGFLTPFEADNYEDLLSRVLQANERAMFCTLRTRIQCEVYRGQKRSVVQHVFNEACIDRGLSTNFLHMECYIDGSYVTTVQADGLIVATPSGSTAYSMSAGGPMVSPSVPCMILTPIAPHSLSFRPVVAAETSDVVIHIPADFGDGEARVSFDGRHTVLLHANDSVRMIVGNCPLPMITASFMDHDWYSSIREKLMWNAIIKKQSPTRDTCLPFDNTGASSDNCSMDFPSCVVYPLSHGAASGYEMGQDVREVDDDMPVYGVNSSDSEQSPTHQGNGKRA